LCSTLQIVPPGVMSSCRALPFGRSARNETSSLHAPSVESRFRRAEDARVVARSVPLCRGGGLGFGALGAPLHFRGVAGWHLSCRDAQRRWRGDRPATRGSDRCVATPQVAGPAIGSVAVDQARGQANSRAAPAFAVVARTRSRRTDRYRPRAADSRALAIAGRAGRRLHRRHHGGRRTRQVGFSSVARAGAVLRVLQRSSRGGVPVGTIVRVVTSAKISARVQACCSQCGSAHV
jgi:hypothetical protein